MKELLGLPPRACKLSAHDRIAIRRKRAEGVSVRELADEYGVSGQAIYNALRAVFVTPLGRLRILPQCNAELPMQRCVPLSASLTVAACAARHEAGKRGGELAESYRVCGRCKVGENNARKELA